MRTRPILSLAFPGAMILAVAEAGAGQIPGTVLGLSTSSAEARTDFRAALYETQLGTIDARTRIAAAIAADSQFALARVYHIVIEPNLSEIERELLISQVLAKMGSASRPERMLATYWREHAAGRGPAAVPILDTLVTLVPRDADVAYIHLAARNEGKTPAEQAENFRRFLDAYPGHTAAYAQAGHVFWRAGDAERALAAADALVKAAPKYWNAHDTRADILLLLGKPRQALEPIDRELELFPNYPYALAKRGMARLMMNDVRRAREDFISGLAVASTASQRFEMMQWNAISYLYERDVSGTLNALAAIAASTKELTTTSALVARTLAHDRAALIEAYLGARTAVPDQLALAAGAVPHVPASHYLHAAIALSKIGEAQGAQDALARYRALMPDSPAIPTLIALLALNANDVPSAEAALSRSTSTDLLTRAVRADVVKRHGNAAGAKKMREEILASSIKQDRGHQIDPLALAGRLHAEKL